MILTSFHWQLLVFLSEDKIELKTFLSLRYDGDKFAARVAEM